MAYECKGTAFIGRGSFGLPTGEDEESKVSVGKKVARQSKKMGYRQASVPILLPPVILPGFEIPEPPLYEEDVTAIKVSLFDFKLILINGRHQCMSFVGILPH